jgi:hypothetical protein
VRQNVNISIIFYLAGIIGISFSGKQIGILKLLRNILGVMFDFLGIIKA